MDNVKIKNARRVTVMGFGIYPKGSGISTALFFAKQGAHVLVTDIKKEQELRIQIAKLKKYKNVKFVLGRHRKQDFINTDLVFQNPSVPNYSPYIQLARKNKIPIINDWSIFLSLCDNDVIGITGTKGKSTTASLIYAFLKNHKIPAVLCGNIGDSPLQYFLGSKKLSSNTIVVAELSSWLLRGFKSVKKSPHIAVITNLYPDHLDKYKSVATYYADKENIFTYQTPDDYLVLNKDNKELRTWKNKARAHIYWFSKKPFTRGNGVYIKGPPSRKATAGQGRSIYFKHGRQIARVCSVNDIKLKGEHNQENVLAGMLPALLYGVSAKDIKNVLQTFIGVPHRLEFVRSINGVDYYNDTTATMPDAVIAALHSFDTKIGNIVLIGGGYDKNLDYTKYISEVNKYASHLILFKGTATDKILSLLKNHTKPDGVVVSSMKQAISYAHKFARKGDVVLLSPGAASYGNFKNEFDRGNQFRALVKKLSLTLQKGGGMKGEG